MNGWLGRKGGVEGWLLGGGVTGWEQPGGGFGAEGRDVKRRGRGRWRRGEWMYGARVLKCVVEGGRADEG